jgi:diaminopimelate decarboxylase
LLNPHAGRPFSHAAHGLACDGVPLARLAKQYGTPLYVYSWTGIAQRYHALQYALTKAFASKSIDAPAIASGLTLCYAVKANSNLTILRKLAALGAGFDIVSGGELERVRAAAPEAMERVVFSGVGKISAEIDLALKADILLFNVESEQEMELLASRASSLRKRARMALRVNPDVFADTHPYISTGLSEHKFGVAISSARKLYARAKEKKYLDPCGVSVHIGSQIRSAAPFGDALKRIAKLVRQLESDGIAIRFVDAGGGFGVDYKAEQPFDADIKAAEYADAVASAWTSHSVHWLFEPGRFLVANAGCLLCRVLYVKKNGRKTFIITDAGMNDLIRPALYNAHHAIEPVVPRKGRRVMVDVVGPVCETGDFFARDRVLEPVQPGDLLAVLDTGAYGFSLSSNYNARPRPAEVLVEGNRATLVRPRETVAELIASEAELLRK